MKKIISTLILASLLSSCVTRRACERRFADLGANVSTTDNTNTHIVIRDTTIWVKIPGDTVEAVVQLMPVSESSLLESSRLGVGQLGAAQLGAGQLGAAQSSVMQSNVSVLNTPLATSTIWLKDGRLHHRLEQKDTTVATTLKGALKTTHKVSQKTIQKTTQKTSINRSQKERILKQAHPTNQLTGWQWTQVYLGRAFLVMVGVWILLKIRI